MSAPTTISALPVLFTRARAVLDEARRADTAAERFRTAHLAALRTAAIVLADRGRPSAGRKRLVSAWVLLESMAPEYATWATYFAAGAALRSAVEAGATSGVSQRLADDQLRAAEDFLALVESSMGLLAA
ncbi:MAG: SAV_6107 family HEPN domain-containing protein [Jatrophihabitans sp.]|uniref:SAV_6107 family HEPN domain-containing protein n=1 Tax=Jatrophihabitans sp. TaxID=1932789 RepID=UPI003F80892C